MAWLIKSTWKLLSVSTVMSIRMVAKYFLFQGHCGAQFVPIHHWLQIVVLSRQYNTMKKYIEVIELEPMTPGIKGAWAKSTLHYKVKNCTPL